MKANQIQKDDIDSILYNIKTTDLIFNAGKFYTPAIQIKSDKFSINGTLAGTIKFLYSNSENGPFVSLKGESGDVILTTTGPFSETAINVKSGIFVKLELSESIDITVLV